MSSNCCSPTGRGALVPLPGGGGSPAPERGGRSASVEPAGPSAGSRHRVEQVTVPAGVFAMGDAHGDRNHGDGEVPVHQVAVSAFAVDATTVTVADFAGFVEDTGYRTEAEVFGFSAVFHLALAADARDVMGQVARTPWWLGVRGADWRHPGGPSSDVSGREDHPVVHVSWNDAQAYCAWAGRRLPTEAEWERASRGGLAGARYPWGDELLDPHGQWRCNIWQGRFPVSNTREDGWLTTAPVRSFAPNGYGLWQTTGNVWEWCADWFGADTYVVDDAAGRVSDPQGAARGQARVIRGGSYLCHRSYCNRYRNAARSSNTADSSSGNTGFRTVAA